MYTDHDCVVNSQRHQKNDRSYEFVLHYFSRLACPNVSYPYIIHNVQNIITVAR